MLPYLERNVADLGCGACTMYENQNVSLTGVDWSEAALVEARKNYPSGTYVRADVCDTGLPSDQFDTVIMLGVLDYIEDWQAVILEAERIKKEGGHIYATLLQKFLGHEWSIVAVCEKLRRDPKQYREIVGNWILIEI